MIRLAGKRLPENRQQGFILLTVLWTLTLLVLGASAFSYWIDDLRIGAERHRLELDQTIREQELLAQIAYTRLVSPRNFQGVAWPSDSDESIGFFEHENADFGGLLRIRSGKAGFLHMAGEVYDVGEGLRMMVQDHAGLIGLGGISPA